MPQTFILTSAAFDDRETIPRRFTCDGANHMPPLAWSDPPEGTCGFALVMDDPDAPKRTFTHWLVYDIPATSRRLGDSSTGKSLRNDFGRVGYGGPCPPVGHEAHRYVFTLYAVDVSSLDVHGQTRAALERALHGHTLAAARLTGRYERVRA